MHMYLYTYRFGWLFFPDLATFGYCLLSSFPVPSCKRIHHILLVFSSFRLYVYTCVFGLQVTGNLRQMIRNDKDRGVIEIRHMNGATGGSVDRWLVVRSVLDKANQVCTCVIKLIMLTIMAFDNSTVGMFAVEYIFEVVFRNQLLNTIHVPTLHT